MKSAKTTDRRIAERMETEWRAQIHAQLYLGEREEITLRQIFDNHLSGSLSPLTLKNARSCFKTMGRYLNVEVKASEFDQRELHRYREARAKEGRKESAIRLHMLTFSSAWGRINPKIYNIPELDIPRFSLPKQKTDYLSEADEERLLTHLQARVQRSSGTDDWEHELRDILVLLLDTGARHNEIARLEWTAVDLQRKTLELWRGKTKTASYVYMTDRVHRILQRRADAKQHDRWVFTNRERTSHRSDCTTRLNNVLRRAGLPYSIHTLRHTFATKMLKAGMTLNDVRVLLGHSSINTTLRYGHLEANDASPKAVAILNQQHVVQSRAKIKAV